MFARATFAAVLFAFIATPAAAEGDNSLFTGLYVGGSAAYEDLDVKVDSFGINFATFSNRDMSYGGLIGWRSALSHRWVAGVEISARASGVAKDIALLGARTANLDPDISYGGSAMLGRVFSERLLVFASAGIVWTKFKNRQSGLTIQSPALRGWRAAAGFELAMTDNVGFRGEATFTSYENQAFQVTLNGFGPTLVDIRPEILGLGGALIIGF